MFILSKIREYLSITKKEWNGMIVLVVLIILAVVAPAVCKIFYKDNKIDAKAVNAAIGALGKTKTVQSAAGNAQLFAHNNKLSAGEMIEINSADSATLTKLHGVGAAFASRIIHYRQRLGGFYYKTQLLEVFGMDTDRYNSFKDNINVEVNRIKKIHINNVNFEQLRQFPYLTYKQMNAIIQYREQHGDYENLADLRQIAIIDNKILRKIEPYLTCK